jgi:hypothetical protein
MEGWKIAGVDKGAQTLALISAIPPGHSIQWYCSLIAANVCVMHRVAERQMRTTGLSRCVLHSRLCRLSFFFSCLQISLQEITLRSPSYCKVRGRNWVGRGLGTPGSGQRDKPAAIWNHSEYRGANSRPSSVLTLRSKMANSVGCYIEDLWKNGNQHSRLPCWKTEMSIFSLQKMDLARSSQGLCHKVHGHW